MRPGRGARLGFPSGTAARGRLFPPPAGVLGGSQWVQPPSSSWHLPGFCRAHAGSRWQREAGPDGGCACQPHHQQRGEISAGWHAAQKAAPSGGIVASRTARRVGRGIPAVPVTRHRHRQTQRKQRRISLFCLPQRNRIHCPDRYRKHSNQSLNYYKGQTFPPSLPQAVCCHGNLLLSHSVRQGCYFRRQA